TPPPTPTRTASPTPTPTHTTSPTPTATGAYPAWVVNHAYKVGDRVSYSGHNYQCLQAHTSQADWTPTAAPALWQFLS
ncbi:MAG TPA: carbohydrate-binding protein, partial [Rugosimonospora sp.]